MLLRGCLQRSKREKEKERGGCILREEYDKVKK